MKECLETKLARAFPKSRLHRDDWGDGGPSPYAWLQIPDGKTWYGRQKWKTVATTELSSNTWWTKDMAVGKVIEDLLGVEVLI